MSGCNIRERFVVPELSVALLNGCHRCFDLAIDLLIGKQK